jgi:hypothetical protein
MALLFLLRYSVLAEQPHLIENRSAFYLWLRLCRAVLNSFLYLPAANPTIFSMIAAANADVPSFVPPFINLSKSYVTLFC